MVKIVDMMGGDNAPGIVLEVEKAINDFKDLEIILFGDEKQYTLNHERIEFRHCSEKLRWKMSLYVPLKEKDSSMVRMAEAVKSGEADGRVSAVIQVL